ncbi:hypothetical protein Prudu_018208 [Prunus dulcis]|uniref:Lipoxygenase domain-containing protein n=1 Tax=Prunus dulcis TaxID=3755 RepID=A0A4Y1RRU6_PRUDU|nr:hypothetical protein Prudu_018208 [Prunus dulcis]
MPEEGTPEYEELKTNPDKAFLKTFTPQLQTLLGMASIEILSRHPVDELYLGRETPQNGQQMQTCCKPLRILERSWKELRKEL